MESQLHLHNTGFRCAPLCSKCCRQALCVRPHARQALLTAAATPAATATASRAAAASAAASGSGSAGSAQAQARAQTAAAVAALQAATEALGLQPSAAERGGAGEGGGYVPGLVELLRRRQQDSDVAGLGFEAGSRRHSAAGHPPHRNGHRHEAADAMRLSYSASSSDGYGGYAAFRNLTAVDPGDLELYRLLAGPCLTSRLDTAAVPADPATPRVSVLLSYSGRRLPHLVRRAHRQQAARREGT
jgi:hypothetical protein